MPQAQQASPPAGPEAAGRRAHVTPFARALTLLEAWSPSDSWLGNLELSQRTGLPTSTVTRLAQSLVRFGYLHHSPADRKYRLAAAVMALGYGAIANSRVQRVARGHMRAYAGQHKAHVHLSARDRLDLIVLECSSSADVASSLALNVGVRVGIASSPMGWALLAALPEMERFYLLENVQRRMPREWGRLRRQSSQGIAQVHEQGWCTSLGERDQDVVVVATPLRVAGEAPLVLSCIGPSTRLSRARIERDLAPRLLATVAAVERQCESERP